MCEVAVRRVPDEARRKGGHGRGRRRLEHDEAQALADVELEHLAEDDPLEGREDEKQDQVQRGDIAGRPQREDDDQATNQCHPEADLSDGRTQKSSNCRADRA